MTASPAGLGRRMPGLVPGLLMVASLLLSGVHAAEAQAPAPNENRCAPTPLGNPFDRPGWNGWGVDAANSRFQPTAAAGMTASDVPRLKVKWAFGFPEGGWATSQPTLVGGRIYVGVFPDSLYSIDAATGCVHWTFKTQKLVRSAISVGPVSSPGLFAKYAVYFGDQQANLYAVDAESGTLLWARRADMHLDARITGTPTLADGRLYVPVSALEETAGANPKYECCKFRGFVVVYDAATGNEIWRTYTIAEALKPTRKNADGVQQWGPAGGSVFNAPTLDLARGVLYIGTGNAYTAPAPDTTDAIMALDLKTGKRLWHRQFTPNDVFVSTCDRTTNRSINCSDIVAPDVDFAQSPILRTLPDGRPILVVGQKTGIGYGIDAASGTVLWQHRVGIGDKNGGMVWGSAADNDQVYFGNGDAVHGPEAAGGLAAVRIATGERVWLTRPPRIACETPADRRCIQAQNAPLSMIPGVVFSGASNGMMRAYSTVDGRIIWEYDTAREYQTLNGHRARGGLVNGIGPTIAGGLMVMVSGYRSPGNVLLAFEPGK